METKEKIEQETGAKVVKKSHTARNVIIVAILTSLILGYFLFGDPLVSEYKRASAIISNNTTYYSKLCILDDIYSDCDYDQEICSGKTLKTALKDNNIEYLKIKDQYYTENGTDIVVYTVEATLLEEINPTYIKNGENLITIVPNGYTLNEKGKCTKTFTKTITIVEEKRQNKDYDYSSNLNIDNLEGYKVLKIDPKGEKKSFKTLPFSELENYKLIADYNEEEKPKNDLHPATLTLKK